MLLRRNPTMMLLLVLLATGATAQVDPFQIEKISSTQLFGRDWLGLKLDAIIDVRRADEFAIGHVPGAMLVDSLASFGTNAQVDGPQALAGCEYCDIAAYCSSGDRAAAALRVLQQAGFKGRLYNAGGITQWLEFNYPVTQSASLAAPCTTNPAVGQQCLANYNARTGASTTSTTTTPQQAGGPGVVQVNFFDWNNPDWTTPNSGPIFEASGTEDTSGSNAVDTTTTPQFSFPGRADSPEPVNPAFSGPVMNNPVVPPFTQPVTNTPPANRPVPVVQWGTAEWRDPAEEFPDFSAVGAPMPEEGATAGGGGTTGVVDTPPTTGTSNTVWNGGAINWGFGIPPSQSGQRDDQTPSVPAPAPGGGSGGNTFVDRWSGSTWLARPGGSSPVGTGATTAAGIGTGTEPMFEASSSSGGGGVSPFQGFSFVNAPGPTPGSDSSATAATGAVDPVSGSSFTDWFSAFSFSRAPQEEEGNVPTGFAPPVRGGTGSSWNNPGSSWSSAASASAETTQVEDTWGNGKVVWLDSLESGVGVLGYRASLVLVAAAPLLVLLF